MKKLFLTSGLVLCMACPAFADLTPMPTTSNNTDCVSDVLGSATGPVDIEAVWTKNSYPVTYVADSHSTLASGMGTDTAEYDTNYTLKALGNTSGTSGVTINEGYHFIEWTGQSIAYTDGNNDQIPADATYNQTPHRYTDGYTLEPYAVVGALQLTARTTWNVNEITFNNNIYPGNNHNSTATYTTSTGVTAAANGQTNLGSLYSAYDHAYLYPTSNDAVAASNQISSIDIPSKSGYVFDGFYLADGETQVIDDEGTILSGIATAFPGNNTGGSVYAHWHAAGYTITYTCGSGVAGSESTGSYLSSLSQSLTSGSLVDGVTYDTPYSLRAVADVCEMEGYAPNTSAGVIGWTCTGGTPSATADAPWAIAGNVVCEANWTQNTITLNWFADENATTAFTSATEGAGSCQYDGAITLPQDVPNKAGYTFQKWQVRESTSNNQGD